MSARNQAPFVGLRPFQEEDSPLFFGRRSQTRELLERLRGNRLVAVVGSSGCGKSSLVRAGLIPALKAGFLVRSHSAWRVLVIKPGKAPLRHLATAVLGEDAESDESGERIAALERKIRLAGADPILERLGRRPGSEEQNILLVVDQFEEIFRFGLHEGNRELRDEAADFVSVLLALAEENALPVYVVLTMRADFIRDCDDVPDLPEALNRSLFLVPRLTREHFREAIEGPIRWAGAEISDRLLDRLLNVSSREFDELPVLQHALFQTWREWTKDGGGPVDSVHYERAGSAEHALDLDAEAALRGLSDEGIDRVRRLLQALTAMDDSNRKIRRPARLSELAGISGLPEAEILRLLGRFRTDERSLLVWSDAEPDPLIDISHESLIRNWQRLSAWADDEAESVAFYRRLARAAADYPERRGLWRNPELQIGLDWRERCAPTRTWAERVAPEADFERAMGFLDESREAREEALARRERAREDAHRQELERGQWEARRRLWRNRAVAAVLVVVSVVAVWFISQQENLERAERLNEYHFLVSSAWSSLRGYPPRSLLLASGAISRGQALPSEMLPSSGRGDVASADLIFLRALARSGGTPVVSVNGPLEAVTMMPDGSGLVTGGDDALLCWTARSAGETVGEDESRRMPLPGVTALAVVGDGRLAVGIGAGDEPKGGIYLLDRGSDGCFEEPRSSWATVASPVTSLAADSEGRWLAALAGDERTELALWDLGAPERREPLVRQPDVAAVAFGGSRESPWLALARSNDQGEGLVEIRVLGDGGFEGRPLEIAPGSGPVQTLAASSGSDRLLVASKDGKARLFELSATRPRSVREIDSLPVQKPIEVAELAPGGTELVTRDTDGRIVLWDVAGEEPRRLSDLPDPAGSRLPGHAISADGRRLFTAHVLAEEPGPLWEIRRWELQAVDPARRIVLHEMPEERVDRGIRRMAFSPDAERVIVLDGSDGSSLLRLDPNGTREPIPSWRSVRAAAFAGDGLLLLARSSGEVEVVRQGRATESSAGVDALEEWAAERSGTRVAALVASPDGRRVMTAGPAETTEGDGEIWTLEVWEPERETAQHIAHCERMPAVVAAAFTPDGRRLIIAGSEGRIHIQDLDGNHTVAIDLGRADNYEISALDVSPDGRLLVAGGDDGVTRFWRLEDGRKGAVPAPSLTIELEGEPIVAVSFTRDGDEEEGVLQVLIATEDGVTRRWPVLREDRYRLARRLVGDVPLPREVRDASDAETAAQVFATLPGWEGGSNGSKGPPGDRVALAARDP